MQTSDLSLSTERVSAGAAVSALLLIALASVWLLQDSINEYIQQTYHRASPLDALTDTPGWHSGSLTWKALNTLHDRARATIVANASSMTNAFNQRAVLTENYHLQRREKVSQVAVQQQVDPQTEDNPHHQHERVAQVEVQQQVHPQTEDYPRRPRERAAQVELQQRVELQQVPVLKTLEEREEPEITARYLSLSPRDRVFMAGDSLMQGVAPHLQRELATRYGIASVNSSKQSTGLAYPGFFDWPATIAKTVQDDPGIRLVVVLLGPNDPWDMPDPARRGGPFLKFKSDGWELVYRERVASIINNNTARGLSTLWVGAPGMRAARLDGQMLWLMDVIKDEVEKQDAVFLDSRSLLPGAGNSGGFKESVDVEGKLVKMRSGDGIHFSTAGQKYLALRIMEILQLSQ